jgi:hypothetical protein
MHADTANYVVQYTLPYIYYTVFTYGAYIVVAILHCRTDVAQCCVLQILLDCIAMTAAITTASAILDTMNTSTSCYAQQIFSVGLSLNDVL